MSEDILKEIMEKIQDGSISWTDDAIRYGIEKSRADTIKEVLDKLDDFVYYQRECQYCGQAWQSLHCPHDGVQKGCPNCKRKGIVSLTNCTCNFVASIEEIKATLIHSPQHTDTENQSGDDQPSQDMKLAHNPADIHSQDDRKSNLRSRVGASPDTSKSKPSDGQGLGTVKSSSSADNSVVGSEWSEGEDLFPNWKASLNKKRKHTR